MNFCNVQKCFIMILCFPLPVIVGGVRTKFKKIKQLERKKPTLPNNLTNIISDKEDNEDELLTLCQNFDMPSFDQIFDEEKMDRIHTDDVQVEVEDPIEKKMVESNHFADQFFADFDPCVQSKCEFSEENLDKKENSNIIKIETPKSALIKTTNIINCSKNENKLKNNEFPSTFQTYVKNTENLEEKINKFGPKNGFHYMQNNLKDTYSSKNGFNLENLNQSDSEKSKLRATSENETKNVFSLKFLQNDLNKMEQMLLTFKKHRECRWKIIRQFLLCKNDEHLQKIPKNFDEPRKKQRLENTKDENFQEIQQKLFEKHKKQIEKGKNKENEQKNPENLDENLKNNQNIYTEEYKFRLISVWKLIDTAILSIEISLLPISPNYSHNSPLFEAIDINTALCDLISAENVIKNLNIYINWIKNWLMLDQMFDNESALDLMKTIKNAIRRAYSTSKYKRRKLNKLWLNLRVYFHLYAAIDQQLSSRMIEDTVDNWEDAVLEWVKVRLFVSNFLQKLNEFGKMAAEVGIEQMRQEQCGKL